MKEYTKPNIEEEENELDDIIAASTPEVSNLSVGYEDPVELPF